MTRRVLPSIWQRAVISAVIAYALVLQALLLAYGGAVQASAAGQDVLCVFEAASNPPDRMPVEAHDGLCCLLGHHGSAPSAGLAPAIAGPSRLSAKPVPVDRFREQPSVLLAAAVLPVGSRAPPCLG